MAAHTVGQRLAQLRREQSAREQRDVLQSEIAKAAGVTTTALSRWERDERIPREPELAKLAKFFGVTPAFLRYGVAPEPTQRAGGHYVTKPGATGVEAATRPARAAKGGRSKHG